MAKKRLTPPLEIRGIFTFNAPFEQQPTKVFEVIALRQFGDIVADGEDVFKDFYEPMGLPASAYKEDEKLGAVLVTLADPHGDILYIPDTYIATYPNQTNFEYHHVIMSVSLGALPTTVDLTFAVDEVKGVVDKVLGINSKVVVASGPKQGVITQEQHESMTQARLAAIQLTESVHARNVRLEKKVMDQQNTITALIKKLQDAGLLPGG
jgi:hypothetical protein